MDAYKEELIAEYKFLSDKLQALNMEYVGLIWKAHIARKKVSEMDNEIEQLEIAKTAIFEQYEKFVALLKETVKD